MKSMDSRFFAALTCAVAFFGVLAGPDGVSVALADECCTEAGYADECWWVSADDDGATCTANAQCASGTCDKTETDPDDPNTGLCSCADDDDCDSGVCNVDNRCGPSWCNGYLICSCWGGCVPASLGTYATPQAMCTDTAMGYPGFCCEGTFPDGIGGVGYCSGDPTCNEGCTDNADCNDGNPCTYDKCVSGGCINVNLLGDWYDSYTDPDTMVTIPHIGAGCPYTESALHWECAVPMCVLNGGTSACDISYNAGGACDWDPTTGPNGDVYPNLGPSSYDAPCYHGVCNATGACVVTLDDGADCDEDSNVCTDGFCEDGVCDESNPLSTWGELDANPECCNDVTDEAPADGVPDFEASYVDDATAECTIYYCDAADFHDGETYPSGTGCTLSPAVDCNDGVCDGAGNCDPDPHPAGAACDSLPEPDDDPCITYACGSGAAAGTCVDTPNEGTACWDPDLPIPLDPCAYAYCDADGICQPESTLGEDCIPPTGYVPCEIWTCEYSDPTYPDTLLCTFDHAATPDPDLETCNDPMTAAQDLGTIGTTLVGPIRDSNECAEDDYDAETAGRFAACAGYAAGTENADYVYDFNVLVDTSGYTLQHVAINLSRDQLIPSTGWDPYLHVREGCEDDSATVGDQMSCNSNRSWTGTYYPTYGGQFSGAAAAGFTDMASVTAGPWPLRDITNSTDTFGADDGIVTENDWHAQAVVDTWSYSNPMPGGDFELSLRGETHYNNDCASSAAYIAAPIMDNFTSWKERWRGTTNHANYVNRGGTGNDTDCGTSTHNASNPASAYFRVEVENETQADWDEGTGQWESVDWGSLYKAVIDPALDATHLNAALTMWNGSSGEASCGFTSGTTHACGGSSGALQEHILADGTGASYKWLEVSNHVLNAKGNYELQMIRVPREFFGFQEAFVGADSGCGASGSSDTWNLGGARVDFVPTNSRLNGYMAKVTSVGSGSWLVNPSNMVCKGTGCTAGIASGQIRDLPFVFPFSGRFFDKVRVDASGRVDLGTGDSSDPYYLDPSGTFVYEDVGNSERSNSDSEFSRDTRFNPMLAPMWGKIIPCMCSETAEAGGGWFADPIITWDNSCYADGDTEARIYVDEATWDGSTVTVVTWDGFDGYQEPREPYCSASSWGSCTDWACDYHYSTVADRSNFLQFQVIIRPDGRFTFFYKSSTAVTQSILDKNGWTVGVSGTWHSGQPCSDLSGNSPNPSYTPDDWCDLVLGEAIGMAATSCDMTSEEVNGVDIYTAGYWCVNKVTNLHNGVAGTWQTGE